MRVLALAMLRWFWPPEINVTYISRLYAFAKISLPVSQREKLRSNTCVTNTVPPVKTIFISVIQ